MCSNPIKNGNLIFSCKRCNDCVATQISGWVFRGMAEKATSQNTYSLTLTYANETQEQRDGAFVFRYSDIQRFFKVLRRAADYQLGVKTSLRYIVAGENGADKGRVHWHVVIFTDFDLLSVGDWRSFVTKKTITSQIDKTTTDPNKVKRLLWSYWPHGLCSVQMPDQGGMHYALKYAFKHQFNIRSSAETARATRAENFSASFFRMSKSPPVGFNWLKQKLATLSRLGAVLPSLRLKVPDTTGYYRPQGFMLEALLAGMASINLDHQRLHGVSCPQWATLLHSVKDQTAVWERLINYGESEENEEFTEISVARAGREARRKAAEENSRAIVRRCGNIVPCSACTRGMGKSYFDRTVYPAFVEAVNAAGGARQLQRDYRNNKTCNPDCLLKDAPSHRAIFAS